MSQTPHELVEKFIDRVKRLIKPDAIKETDIFESFSMTEYYFRQMLYTHKLNQKQLDALFDRFKWGLVHAGDPVGLKSSLCIGEALTQAALNAIHTSVGGVSEYKVIRSAGITRFQELLTGAEEKHFVITLHLYEDDYEHSANFANEMETFYLKDILVNEYLQICDTIEEKVLNIHSPSVSKMLEKEVVNYWYVFAVLDISKLADYNIHVCDIIEKLMENYNEIAFITGYVLNRTQFGAYVYFKESVSQTRIQIILEEWLLQRNSTIVHGGLLKNCYVAENKANAGHFYIEANAASPDNMALENIIYDPRVDPYGCKTSKMRTTYKMFGVCETAARLHEEILYTATNLSDTRAILPRHYKMLADNILSSGTFKYANRNSLKRDEAMDFLKLIAFETPVNMIQSALQQGRKFPIMDPVPASLFGEMPGMGTGVSKTTLYSVSEIPEEEEEDEKDENTYEEEPLAKPPLSVETTTDAAEADDDDDAEDEDAEAASDD